MTTKPDEYERFCMEMPREASALLAKYENAVNAFLEGRMKHFADSRFVDDDLVTLAAEFKS